MPGRTGSGRGDLTAVTTDTDVKLAIYALFEETGTAPSPEQIAESARTDVDFVKACLLILADQHVLVLQDDGASIRMASPFSGVPTQHEVESMGVRYHANCAWDAMGILAALDRDGVIRSRCEQSKETLELAVGFDGPEPCDWVYHCQVPAARWWDDIVHT